MLRQAALLLLTLATPAAALEPGVTRFTLDNGLTGVVIEDHRAPVVVQMVWYRVGSADDPAGASGLAHFLEHLMFRGTQTLPAGAFSRIVAENGGSDNAFTSHDYTAYFQRVAADRLDVVMAMEADRMQAITPSDEAVAAERDVVLSERRQVVETEPDGPFSEALEATLFLNHPYGRPIIGWEHEIAALTRDGALAFHDAHYAPDNAILVVAGDVTRAEVEAMARRHFGSIPAAGVAARIRPQEPEPRAARRVAMEDPRVREPTLSRSYLAPTRSSGPAREAAALSLLADLLGGSGDTSLLARRLVLGGVALDAGAWYSETGLDPQSFGLYLAPRPGVSLAEAETALDLEIARFLAEGPDPAELDRLRSRIRASEIYARDDISRRANRAGAALATGLTLEDVEAWPALLQSITPDEIHAAAQTVLRPERSVTGTLTPPRAAELAQ